MRKTRWRPVVEAAVAKAGAGVTMAGARASGGGSMEPAGASARPRLPPHPLRSAVEAMATTACVL